MTPVAFLDTLPGFRAKSWDGWRRILRDLTPEIRELFVAAGRGSGKSRIAAAIALYFATRDYPRAPGERIYVGVFAPDRKQAIVTFRYMLGLFRSVPELEAFIEAERADSVDLVNGVTVEVLTASAAAPRGRSYAMALVEEAAFLPDEDSANPDVELIRGVRPGLARVPRSVLVVISSPYRRAGVLYEAVRAGNSSDRLVVVADTRSLNPTFDVDEIGRAFREDPVAAASEYGQNGHIEFRKDISGLLTQEALSAVVAAGVHELPPEPERTYFAHLDAATGSGSDSAALAIAYSDAGTAVLAALRRWEPPFSASTVAREAAQLLGRYGLATITIDRFAPGLVADLLAPHGIQADVAASDTSAAFLELLAAVNAGLVRLLDDAVLLRELARLERRAGPNGRELVSHSMRGHDDVAAAAAFALLRARSIRRCSSPLCTDETCDGRPPFGLLFSDAYNAWRANHPSQSELAAARATTVEAEPPEDAPATQNPVAWVLATVQNKLRALVTQNTQQRPEVGAAPVKALRAEVRTRRQIERARARSSSAEGDRVVQERRARSAREVLNAIDRKGHWWPGE